MAGPTRRRRSTSTVELPPGVPKFTPTRTPRKLSSRVRRWVESTRPALWTWLTGNTDMRHGHPWKVAALALLLVLLLWGAASMLLTQGRIFGEP